MLELEELARAVGSLSQRDDPGVADDALQRLQVREAVARFNRL